MLRMTHSISPEVPHAWPARNQTIEQHKNQQFPNKYSMWVAAPFIQAPISPPHPRNRHTCVRSCALLFQEFHFSDHLRQGKERLVDAGVEVAQPHSGVTPREEVTVGGRVEDQRWPATAPTGVDPLRTVLRPETWKQRVRGLLLVLDDAQGLGRHQAKTPAKGEAPEGREETRIAQSLTESNDYIRNKLDWHWDVKEGCERTRQYYRMDQRVREGDRGRVCD